MEDIHQTVQNNYGGKTRIRACGLCIEKNKMLLLNHAGLGSENNFWSPPGGGVEFGETLEACLKREFKEETGLNIKQEKFLFVNEFLELPLHAIELFFEVKKVGGKLKLGNDPEHEVSVLKEIRWFTETEIQQIPTSQIHNLFHGFTDFSTLLCKTGLIIPFQQ